MLLTIFGCPGFSPTLNEAPRKTRVRNKKEEKKEKMVMMLNMLVDLRGR
jgi:hypothetical protein